MSARDTGDPLDGIYHELPFLGGDPADRIAPLYGNLVSEYSVPEVLVLKRFPTGIETFTDQLAAATAGVERPRVRSINRHAGALLAALPDPPQQLSDTERGELAHRFLEEAEWETQYLSRASRYERFETDVPRLTKVVSWRGEPLNSSHRPLDEIGSHHREFQEWLASHGYLERGAVIPTVIDALDAGDISADVLDFEAILVIEFEEFAAVDRAYLDRLSTYADCELHCVGEADSSIQRVWNEPGTVRDTVAERAADEFDNPPVRNKPEVVATLFATGETPSDPPAGAVDVVYEDTFRDQVRAVADEIERLRGEHGWAYDEFAIGFRDSSEPIGETVRLLQQAGIPTASATVSGFADDPAVRELRNLVDYLAPEDPGTPESATARDGTFDDAVIETIEGEADSLEGALRRWALETDLKERIAAEHEPLEAKAQFSHVADVFSLAGFLDETPVVEATWANLSAALDRAVQNATTEVQTAEVDVKENGVLVDAVRVMKNASWKAVFMLNLVEGTYPSDPDLTGLFPTAEVALMPDFPGVTDVSAADVRETFTTADDAIADPFRRYYRELARRQLAVGARAADERLYLGLFGEESGELNRQLQPSRYLIEAVEAVPWIEGLEHDAVHGQSGAIEFTLSRVDHALAEVKGADVRGADVDLDAVERDLAGIQELLTASGERGEQLRAAVAARVDFAAGEVRRDD
ncbi:MAG: DNA helicase UvrD [Halodesulfurarchaeum sp.]|nr:DNA helicase UvrD [Halodesulfurarchaeum sp.]